MMNHGKIWDKLYIEIAKAGGTYLKASDIAKYMRELEDEMIAEYMELEDEMNVEYMEWEDEMIAEYMKWEDEMFAEAIRK